MYLFARVASLFKALLGYSVERVPPVYHEVSLMGKHVRFLAFHSAITGRYYLAHDPVGYYPTPKFGDVSVGAPLLAFRIQEENDTNEIP